MGKQGEETEIKAFSDGAESSTGPRAQDELQHAKILT